MYVVVDANEIFFVNKIQVAKAVSHALNNCINCLPGQKDVDEALKNIAESSKKLLSNQVCKFYILRRLIGFCVIW